MSSAFLHSNIRGFITPEANNHAPISLQGFAANLCILFAPGKCRFLITQLRLYCRHGIGNRMPEMVKYIQFNYQSAHAYTSINVTSAIRHEMLC